MIALRYNLGGDISWSPVLLELKPTGDNDAVNLSRYSHDVTPLPSGCPTSEVVSLMLPELSPGLYVVDLCRVVSSWCYS